MSTRFEPGAKAPEGFIPLSQPVLQGNEWAYVKECLDTSWVSSAGQYVDRFEKMLADTVGAQFAIATSTGTAALHIALELAGVREGDEVLVSTLTFIASANAIRYRGAWPVFVDAEPRYWQMDAQLVAEFLANECVATTRGLVNCRTGRVVRAILPVHVLGHPAEMDAILELARQYGLAVVEDAAESLGAEYRGRKVGQLSRLTCFSFNGNKTITTGGGGMIVTDDAEFARRARYLITQAKDDPVEYIHHEVGYNYRMPNVLAAIGCAQLEQLAGYLENKRRTADCYRSGFANIPGITLMAESPDARGTYWLSTIQVEPSAYGVDRRYMRELLEHRRIQSRPLWQPLHQSPAYRGCQSLLSGVAELLAGKCLSLPSSANMTDGDRQRVVAAVEEIHRLAMAAEQMAAA